MHIKIVNTQSKYKRIIMRSDDPGRVYGWKGYGAVNRLNCCAVLRGTDGVYSSSDWRLCEAFFFNVVWICIGSSVWASQYEVDGGPGFRWVLRHQQLLCQLRE